MSAEIRWSWTCSVRWVYRTCLFICYKLYPETPFLIFVFLFLFVVVTCNKNLFCNDQQLCDKLATLRLFFLWTWTDFVHMTDEKLIEQLNIVHREKEYFCQKNLYDLIVLEIEKLQVYYLHKQKAMSIAIELGISWYISWIDFIQFNLSQPEFFSQCRFTLSKNFLQFDIFMHFWRTMWQVLLYIASFRIFGPKRKIFQYM